MFGFGLRGKVVRVRDPRNNENSLGKVLMVILYEAHKQAVLEIAHVKTVMREKCVEVLERESLDKFIWVKYKDNNEVYEATYPKIILMPEVKCRLNDLFQV